jgi:two-component system KDP operon response regulator KdpE
MTHILIIEDEPALARALAITLSARGYQTTVAVTGRAGLDRAADAHPDLILLDLGLPDLDGTAIIEAVRGWSQVPIVVLSARQTSHDKVEALDRGADDYVSKPFAMDELLARIRAASRRASTGETDPIVQTATFAIDLAAGTVTRDGQQVRLTPTEWRLLAILARHPGRIVGQRDLLRELRGPDLDRESHYLRVYLAQLRRKLEPDPARPRHLITEPGIGYRLVP